MSVWKRWALRLTWAVLGTVTLGGVILTWTLTTEAGAHTVLAFARDYLPESLRWNSVTGRIVGPLVFGDVEWSTATEHIRVEQVVIDVRLLALLGKKVHLDSLHISGVVATVSSQDTTGADEPAREEPEGDTLTVPLPFELQVDRFVLTEARVAVDNSLNLDDVQLVGHGSLETIFIDSLVVAASNGRLHLKGECTLQPELSWQLEATATELDPAKYSDALSDWEGDLSAKFGTAGTWREKPQFSVSLEGLSGTLRNQPLSGRARAHVADSSYHLDSLQLDWGSLHLEADGHWTDSITAKFALAAPDLGSVIPDAAGAVHIQGQAHGTLSKPEITATLTADSASWRDYSLDHATCDANVSADSQAISRVKLTARGIAMPDFNVNSLRLDASGTPLDHAFEVDLTSSHGTVELSGQSSFADSIWQGKLHQLTLRQEQVGDWHLTLPVVFSLESDMQSWSAMCLQSDSGRFCAAGRIQPDSWHLDMTIDSLALSLLKAIKPGAWSASGRLSAQADLQSDAAGILTGTMSVQPFSGWFASGEDTLVFDPFAITLGIATDSLIASLVLAYKPSLSTPAAHLESEFILTDFNGLNLNALPQLKSLYALPWSLDLHAKGVTAEHLGDLLPDGLDLYDAISAQASLRSTSTRGLEGDAGLQFPAGSYSVVIEEDTTLVQFDSSALQCSAYGDSITAGVNLAFAPVGVAGRATIAAEVAVSDIGADLLGRAPDMDTILAHLPWSAQLVVDGVEPDHLSGFLPAQLELTEAVAVELNLYSRQSEGLEGSAEVRFPAGRYTVVSGDSTTALYWETVTAQADVDSAGLHATMTTALGLEDQSQIGRMEASAHLPNFKSIASLGRDQELAASVKGRLGLAVVDLVSQALSETRGEAVVDVGITGHTNDLQVLGSIQVEGRTDIPDMGLSLEEISISAMGRPQGIEYSGQARSGKGTLTISGSASRIPSAEHPTTLEIKGSDFDVLNMPQYRVTVTPDLRVTSTGTRINMTGDMLIPVANIELLELPESAVPVSKDVVFVGPDATEDSLPSVVTADINLRLGDQVFFRGLGFSSFLDGQIHVSEKPGATTRGRGELQFRQGRYRGYGQEFDVDPGRLIFNGDIDNPEVDVLAWRLASDNTRAGFKITGRAQNLVINTFSDPQRSDEEVMSYIFFGRPLNQGTESDQMRASDAAAFMGGNILAMQAAGKVGLDDARIEPGTKRNDAAFFAGKYLSPRLYVAYGTGIYESINTLRVRYILSKHWTLQAETGTRETADIVYQIER